MLFFGHTGITLGVATMLANLPPYRARRSPDRGQPNSSSATTPQKGRRTSPFDLLSGFVDIRVLLIGSLLPDIIDKPLGRLLLREVLANGRTYGHTLAFLLLISTIGAYLYRRSRSIWLLALSFGTAMHLLLDQMWHNPRTLFWPWFGYVFDKTDVRDWIPNMLHALVTNPSDYVSETIGLAVVLWLTYIIIRRKRTWAFVKRGEVR